MKTGYEIPEDEIDYVLTESSSAVRKEIADKLRVKIVRDGDDWTFIDPDSGDKFCLGDVHRRSQEEETIQRYIYNLWMFYAR